MTDNIEGMAAQLVDEHRGGVRFHRFDGVSDLATAYRVQKAYVGMIGGQRSVAGYKIGLTSAKMQAMCGIDSPIAGVIFSDRVVASGARLDRSHYGHLGLEFEICARLDRDLAPWGGPCTRADAAAAVGAVCAAVELVDDRHADYSVLDIGTLVADNSWNAGAVLGDFVAPPADLAAVEGVVYQDGEEIGRGRGEDALGHPFEPLAWLANHLASQGQSLRKGDIVMTGSIVTTRFPEGPFDFRFDIAGIGSVEVGGA